ncbi:MAG: imidazole glycerol phosphate synthase subunit HisH [bacterium]|nr:imidazole glycerol phosphate synthase subunit HisH [Candidatus Sumerlaeota bacterium]
MIVIVDYGMGNLRSVEKAFVKLGYETCLVSDTASVARANKLVVPGVGAFGDAMKGLAARGLTEPLRQYAQSGRPMLGICLGMQIFFEHSEEDPGIKGLGIMRGCVKRFRMTDLKIPHMGWNNIIITTSSRLLADLGTLNGGTAPKSEPYVYFVHSYYVAPDDPAVIAATADYGIRFAAAVESGAVMGTQFHPEKSQAVGLKILKNFARL